VGGTNVTTTEPEEFPGAFEPGAVVAIREIWDGRIWEARPAVVVRDDPNLTMFHVPPRVRCQIPVGADGAELRLPVDGWELAEVARSDRWNLSFAFPDTPYAVILGYDADARLDTYYVNLQTPLVRSPAGFDMVEHVLDVVIPPERTTWSWKDEDELAVALERGMFSEEDAGWFRHWGERAVEHVLLREPPFDEDWSGWRPEPGWADAELPANWDLVPA